MGIKTAIRHSELPSKYQNYKLIETKDGNVSTVYLLDDVYVLKIFEKNTLYSSIENEANILFGLKDLCVPKVVDNFTIRGYKVVVYTQISGECVRDPKLAHIKEIALFLKRFHIQSKNIPITSSNRYKKSQLQEMISKSNDKTLLKA